MSEPPVAPSGRPPVTSVVQATALLRHLAALPDGAGVNAISRATGIGLSSCFNVLRTLVGEDLVSFDAETKRYRLGLGTVDLARFALHGDALVNAARGPMARLAERHNAAVGLWRLTSRERLILILLAEADAATRIHMQVGQRQPAHAGAAGRAVLAARGADNAVVAKAYARVRWLDAPGSQAFLSQVHDARRRGWATDIGNINHGIATVASAVCERPGSVRFVLSVSIFAGRESEAGLAAIGQDLSEHAKALQSAIYGPRAS